MTHTITTFAMREYKLISAINKTRLMKKADPFNPALKQLEIRLINRMHTNMSNFKQWEYTYGKK
jgi:hypothetical protein